MFRTYRSVTGTGLSRSRIVVRRTTHAERGGRRSQPNGISPNGEGGAEMTPEPAIDVEAFKKFEREGYSGVARGYDRVTATVTSQVNQAVLDAVAAGPGASLLDVACGPGWLSAA